MQEVLCFKNLNLPNDKIFIFYHWEDIESRCPKLKMTNLPHNGYYIIFLVITSSSKATDGIPGVSQFKQDLKIY